MFNLKSIAAALLIAGAAPLASAGTLTFTVDGVETRGGTLYVGVQTEDQFMQWDGIAGEQIEAPTAGTHTVSFDLPAGDYSVSVWHDMNGDNEFNMDANGMPLEGWAMINGSKLRAVPTFDKVKISVTESGAEARETIVYPQ